MASGLREPSPLPTTQPGKPSVTTKVACGACTVLGAVLGAYSDRDAGFCVRTLYSVLLGVVGFLAGAIIAELASTAITIVLTVVRARGFPMLMALAAVAAATSLCTH